MIWGRNDSYILLKDFKVIDRIYKKNLLFKNI